MTGSCEQAAQLSPLALWHCGGLYSLHMGKLLLTEWYGLARGLGLLSFDVLVTCRCVVVQAHGRRVSQERRGSCPSSRASWVVPPFGAGV